MMKAIVTGATGMVGEEMLHECLLNPLVEQVLAVVRKTTGVVHPKLKECLVPDFFDLQGVVNQLRGYDACFFCLGVSSVGMKEAEFKRLTYDLTLHFAQTLAAVNNNLTFCYISGAGTDSTEKGRQMWARVKGKTENDLMKLPFKAVYNFRPGYLQPTLGMQHTLKYYRYIKWMYPFFNAVFPAYVSTLKQLAKAMINIAAKGYSKSIIEVKDIRIAAAQ